MNKCPYYKSAEKSDTGQPRCRHQRLKNTENQPWHCNGELFNCRIQLDDESLSSYVEGEVRSKRADLIYNERDLQGALRTETDSWLTFEMMRRFGQRQTRGIVTILSLKRLKLELSRTSPPVPFGDWTIFPLSLA